MQRVVLIVSFIVDILQAMQRATVTAAPDGKLLILELPNIRTYPLDLRGIVNQPGILAEIALATFHD